MREAHIDILIVGAGLGGVAGALAALRLGKRVILTEETAWIGGQLTSQAVPPDEHPWIEMHGCTATYRDLRNRIREWYRRNYPLLPEYRSNPKLNPGGGYVSALCHEPRAALDAMHEMLAPWLSSGRLTLWEETIPVAAETDGGRVVSVTLRHLRDGDETIVSAPYILDATELGDLLELANVEHVIGAEAQSETERTARPGRSRSARPAGDHLVLRGRPPARRGPHDREARPVRLLEGLPGGFLAGQTALLVRREPNHPGEAPPRDLRAPDRRHARPRLLALPAHPRQGEIPGRHVRQRYQPRQLAADRLLAWAADRSHRRGECEAPGGVVPAQPVVPLLDANRGANRRRRHWLSRACASGAMSPARRTGWPRRPTSGSRAASGPSSRWSKSTSGSSTSPDGRAAKFHDSVGVGSYRIDLHPTTGAAHLRRHQLVAVPDPARCADPAAGREPAAGEQEPRASPTSPTAATGCTRSNGTSAKRRERSPPGRWKPANRRARSATTRRT